MSNIKKVYVPAMLCIHVNNNKSNKQIELMVNALLTDDAPALNDIKTINGIKVDNASLWIPSGDDVEIYD